MYKILYAANNSISSLIQLERFYKVISNNNKITIKIAAYNKSSPKNVNVFWTLDSLLDIKKINRVTHLFDKKDVKSYFEQVKIYNPDLIISDNEIFTSYIGSLLNKKIWRCTSYFMHDAFSKNVIWGTNKTNLIHNNNKHLYNLDSKLNASLVDKSFIYSHLCDHSEKIKLLNGHEWIRPYYFSDVENKICQHNIVGILNSNDKKYINFLNQNDDVVLFSKFHFENYKPLKLKSIYFDEEYACNIANCNYYVCENVASYLADAFYNRKFANVLFNNEVESSFPVFLSEKYGLCKQTSIYDKLIKKDIDFSFNKEVKFLHEKIEEEL